MSPEIDPTLDPSRPRVPWAFPRFDPLDESATHAAVLDVFAQLYRSDFQAAENANPALPIEIRAMRSSADWTIFLLLTPWMLARLFLAHVDPDVEIPADWSAARREHADAQVLGPGVRFEPLGHVQQAHLNYHPTLGHYLIQPLVLAMDAFDCADAVFARWSEVIATRDRAMEEQRAECGWQREVSRREFLSRLGGRSA